MSGRLLRLLAFAVGVVRSAWPSRWSPAAATRRRRARTPTAAWSSPRPRAGGSLTRRRPQRRPRRRPRRRGGPRAVPLRAVPRPASRASPATRRAPRNAELGATPHPTFEDDFEGVRDPPSLWGADRTAPTSGTPGGRRGPRDRDRHDRQPLPRRRVAERGHHRRAGCRHRPPTSDAARTRTSFDSGTRHRAPSGPAPVPDKGGLQRVPRRPGLHGQPAHDTLVPKRTAADTDPGAKVPPGTFNTAAAARPPQHRRRTCTTASSGRCATSSSSTTSAPRFAPLRLTQAEISDLVAFLQEL
jgi:hypothetical protein